MLRWLVASVAFCLAASFTVVSVAPASALTCNAWCDKCKGGVASCYADCTARGNPSVNNACAVGRDGANIPCADWCAKYKPGVATCLRGHPNSCAARGNPHVADKP